MNYSQALGNRIQNRAKRSLIDVNTKLEHFAIISYRVPVERIIPLIPKPFKPWTYHHEGKEYALISAVPFHDKDFSFYRLGGFPKFRFYQTNFRAYIIDERNGNLCAWFFGTTLGSIYSFIPKKVWNMPWERGKYDFSYQEEAGKYSEYKMNFYSKHGKGVVDISSSAEPMDLLEGFSSLEEQYLILTHPVIGYYYSKGKKLGTYEIWHSKMELHQGMPEDLYFEFFEKLGLVEREEMMQPHSVLITPEIEFDVLLPPRKGI